MVEQKAQLRHGLIDRIRKFSGLVSDAAIADAMGVSRQVFSNVATGKNAPSMEFCIGLQRAFGLTPGEAVEIVTIQDNNTQQVA